MSIGLASEQLLGIFFDSAIKRLSQAQIDRTMAELGLNPKMAELEKVAKERYPSMDYDQVLAIITILMSFMDCIVQNNEALTKTIPHIDA